MHYWGNDLNDDDDEKDMQLPFKTVAKYPFLQIAVPVTKTGVERQKFCVKEFLQPLFQEFYVSDPAISGLFRPPRV